MHSVSILIPCRQERNFIGACLDSVSAFELPADTTIEILVLDGMSTDGTREIVSGIEKKDPRDHLIDNPRKTQSAALNLGISLATGDYVMRLDAHSVYPSNYLRLCIDTALRTGAENTGGVVATMPRGEGYQASLVQALTTHAFGVGDSGFRTDAAEGVADTVPYGFFKREIFNSIGLFDERLVRAQDYEMNRRIGAAGGTVWRNPHIQLSYYQQPDLPSFIRKQIVYEAPYNAYLWYLAPYAFTPRHAITGVFAFGVLAGVVLSPFSAMVKWAFLAVMSLYAVLAILSGVQQAIRYREPRHVIFAPIGFFLYHFMHGLGVLYGLARLATGTAPVQSKQEPWPGAGQFRAWPRSKTEPLIASTLPR
jgi:glycosyltransferase involved in cell wall biosynthesis